MKNQHTLLAALLLALTACGDDPVPPPSLTAEQALAALEQSRIDQLCAAAFDCPAVGYKPDLVPTWARRYPTKDACLASPRVKASIGHQLAQQRKYLDEGLRTIDGAQAKRCIDALNAQLTACAFLTEPTPTACLATFLGARTQGQPCRFSDDCASGLECDDPGYCEGQCVPRTCGAQTCTGDTTCVVKGGARTCEPPAKPGEPCDDRPCDASSTCRFEDSGAVCVANGSVSDGAPCDNDRQCGAESYCGPDGCARAAVIPAGGACVQGKRPGCAGGAACVEGKLDATSGELRGKCAAPIVAGKPCYQDEECGADLRCVGVSLGVAGSCSSLRASGEECLGDQDCASGVCDQDTTTFESTCQEPATAQLFSCPLTPTPM